MNVLLALPLLPPLLSLAVAPSGTAIVRAATIPSTRPRPPRPQSAFARRPLRPHIALERVSPPRELRSEEHTSELQSHLNLVCRLLLEKQNNTHSALPL